MRSVRIVHGRGTALKPEVERWCREMGVPCELDPGNPGSMRIFPQRRTLPEVTVTTTLRDKGLTLTPEEEAYLRDPEVMERARQEALRRKREEERRQVLEAATRTQQKRRDESLWLAEIDRLDRIDRRHGSALTDGAKPTPPKIVPPAEIKHQEGYWRSELVRVADTDTDTLKKQKRTGLDKLAPPMETAKAAPTASPEPEKKKPARPQRDTAADQALFEAEMARLAGFGPDEPRRSNRG
jgi:DNA-binding transcriptional MerR regulator